MKRSRASSLFTNVILPFKEFGDNTLEAYFSYARGHEHR